MLTALPRYILRLRVALLTAASSVDLSLLGARSKSRVQPRVGDRYARKAKKRMREWRGSTERESHLLNLNQHAKGKLGEQREENAQEDGRSKRFVIPGQDSAEQTAPPRMSSDSMGCTVELVEQRLAHACVNLAVCLGLVEPTGLTSCRPRLGSKAIINRPSIAASTIRTLDEDCGGGATPFPPPSTGVSEIRLHQRGGSCALETPHG